MKLTCWSLMLVFFVSVLHAQTETASSFALNLDSCATKSSTKEIIVGDINLEGNTTTKDKILFREITFRSGDTLNCREFCEKIVQSRQNLLNRSIFNFVQMDTLHDANFSQVIHVNVSVIERWYIWPLPIFELADRNFNAWWETKDFRRANYGVFLTYNNFRGRLEQLKVLLRAGYNQNYYLLYEVPYITEAQNLGLGIQMGYSLSREVPYLTMDNKQLFYRAVDSYARKEFYASLKVSYRDGIHTSHSLSMGYEKSKYADTLLDLNPDFVESREGKYQMIHINYYFKRDFRDSKPYPLNGYYWDVDFHQYGFGLMPDEPLISTLKTTFDIYRPISKRWFWASSVTARITGSDFQPYFMQKALGYGNDFIRSYELYVIDGKSHALLKSNLKFALVQPTMRQLPLIKSDKFGKIHFAAYLNWLFDIGYAHNPKSNPTNNFQNKLLYGTGIGLDLVTYYDLVWRFETSVNQYGSAGFFIHFVAPI